MSKVKIWEYEKHNKLLIKTELAVLLQHFQCWVYNKHGLRFDSVVVNDIWIGS